MIEALEQAVACYRGQVLVVKIGGSTLGSEDTALEDLVRLQRMGILAVVVHGGGAHISEWLARLGLGTSFVGGLRVTDAATLQVVVAVLAGLVNKELVAHINRRGGRAVGICGVDGGLLHTAQTEAALGYVGQVNSVNPTLVTTLLQAGYLPVVAPTGLNPQSPLAETPILNINADTAAGELALALGATGLIFLTDVPGIYDGEGRLQSHLTEEQVRRLSADQVIQGGMIPKVEACLRAHGGVPRTDIVDGRLPHALLRVLAGESLGTQIR